MQTIPRDYTCSLKSTYHHQDIFLQNRWNKSLNKMCLWNEMPPIMANSKDGQGHKDKYLDTSRIILSQDK